MIEKKEYICFSENIWKEPHLCGVGCMIMHILSAKALRRLNKFKLPMVGIFDNHLVGSKSLFETRLESSKYIIPCKRLWNFCFSTLKCCRMSK